MMQQKFIVFGQFELAEKNMKIKDPKEMKKAAQRRGIPNFNQSSLERHSNGVVHKGNMHKFTRNL